MGAAAQNDAIRSVFDRKGFEVTSQSDWKGLEAVEEQEPDLALVDLSGNPQEAWNLLRRWKEHEPCKAVPLMVAALDSSAAGHLLYPQPHAVEGRGAKVLLVEDDADLAAVITKIFARVGMEIVCAQDGEEAVALAESVHPDLLLLDVGLPKLNGFEVVTALRGREGSRCLPLVVYSAKDFSMMERNDLTLGPTEFLTKTKASPDQLLPIVASLLQSGRTA
jgi:DNA-binding response OmpR family regulator